MEFEEYRKPDMRTVELRAEHCVLSNSPGSTNEEIGENKESVSDDEVFNW